MKIKGIRTVREAVEIEVSDMEMFESFERRVWHRHISSPLGLPGTLINSDGFWEAHVEGLRPRVRRAAYPDELELQKALRLIKDVLSKP